MKTSSKLMLIISALALATSGAFGATPKLSGNVKVDGSSTVFPITEAVAEEFGKLQRKVRVTVGVSGTGGGFKKFTVGETDISDASRPIKKKEMEKAKKHGIEYLEMPVAYDGISVVVNKANTWVDYLTVSELKRIWQTGSTVKTWKDIRPSWPKQAIKLYGPGTDSGTFDYFTEAVNGKSQASRADFTKSEDDNVLVTGVAGDKNSLGYFGFAYYVENKDKIKVVPIKDDVKNGKTAKAIVPSMETINNGTYSPLSRPIFIYVSKKSAAKKQVNEFVKFYMNQAATLSKDVGYVPLPEKMYKDSLVKFNKFASSK